MSWCCDLPAIVPRAKQEIERKQQNLLEAHYNDAIPIDMLRTEQKRLDPELLTVTRKLRDLTADFTRADGLITQALDLAQYIGASYRQAPEQIRGMFNQLVFEKIEITHHQHQLEAVLQPPFDLIFGAATKILVATTMLDNCLETEERPPRAMGVLLRSSLSPLLWTRVRVGASWWT